MLHSQLKIKYPSCPFLWDTNNNYQFIEYSYDRQYILDIINKLFTDNKDDNSFIDESINFISNISDAELNLFDITKYTYIKQKIQKNKKDYFLNFHTVAYKDINGSFINQDFISIISWIVIPIIGNIKIHPISYSINRDVLNNTNNDLNINNELDAHILSYRKNIRRIHKIRDREKEQLKSCDTYVNKSTIVKRDINKQTFDYTFEMVGIKKINNVYRFYPHDSGKICIDDYNRRTSYFVSIVRHKKNLHITLHEIEWI